MTYLNIYTFYGNLFNWTDGDVWVSEIVSDKFFFLFFLIW